MGKFILFNMINISATIVATVHKWKTWDREVGILNDFVEP